MSKSTPHTPPCNRTSANNFSIAIKSCRISSDQDNSRTIAQPMTPQPHSTIHMLRFLRSNKIKQILNWRKIFGYFWSFKSYCQARVWLSSRRCNTTIFSPDEISFFPVGIFMWSVSVTMKFILNSIALFWNSYKICRWKEGTAGMRENISMTEVRPAHVKLHYSYIYLCALCTTLNF